MLNTTQTDIKIIIVMSKDPAFLFYPNDWLGGTMGMTFEEKGAYMELLMMQFNRGHMTSHMIGQAVGQLWDKIQDKFIKDDNGLYYNDRLDIEIEKRRNFCNSRRNNKDGVNQHTKTNNKKVGHMTSHMTGHMEDEDVNINDNIYSQFYNEEILKANNDEDYLRIIKVLYGENDLGLKLDSVLKMKYQLTYEQGKKIMSYKSRYGISISNLLEEMENWDNLKKRNSVYKTFLTFMNNKYPQTKEK